MSLTELNYNFPPPMTHPLRFQELYDLHDGLLNISLKHDLTFERLHSSDLHRAFELKRKPRTGTSNQCPVTTFFTFKRANAILIFTSYPDGENESLHLYDEKLEPLLIISIYAYDYLLSLPPATSLGSILAEKIRVIQKPLSAPLHS